MPSDALCVVWQHATYITISVCCARPCCLVIQRLKLCGPVDDVRYNLAINERRDPVNVFTCHCPLGALTFSHLAAIYFHWLVEGKWQQLPLTDQTVCKWALIVHLQPFRSWSTAAHTHISICSSYCSDWPTVGLGNRLWRLQMHRTYSTTTIADCKSAPRRRKSRQAAV